LRFIVGIVLFHLEKSCGDGLNYYCEAGFTESECVC